MSKISKKLIPSLILTILVMVLIPLPASAATDAEVVAATDDAAEYLADNQNNDGSISGFGGETDWTVVAITAKGEDPAEFDSSTGNSTVDYMKDNVTPDSALATDVERRIIAIDAAGQDTKNFDGVDYNAKLAAYHNNNQIGDVTLLNDDIFGVIAIGATDDDSLLAMAQDGYDYFLAHQKPDGGFSYTTATCDFFCGSDSNDTAAAIIAIYAGEDMNLTHTDLQEIKDKAIAYLLSTQKPDGGFGYDTISPSDGSSTSWALMALNVIGDSVLNQALSARNWLLANQNSDGGFSFGAYGVTSSDTYTTAHAIIALQGTTWLLNPAPITATATPTPTSNEGDPEDTQTKSETASTSSSSNSNQGQVLAATTTDKNSPNQDNKASGGNIGASAATEESTGGGNGISYSLYGLAALFFIAAGWFVIQSRQKQGI